MLKKTLLATCVGVLLIGQNAQAGDTAQTGALGGAAGGAILGQAIGRNTEGTLLGTAIGGVLGYMIGNEMEKDQVQTVRTYSPRPRVEQYENDYEERVVLYRPRPVVVYERPVVYCPPQRVVFIDRDRDEPPRWGHRRGHGHDHWRSGRYERD